MLDFKNYLMQVQGEAIVDPSITYRDKIVLTAITTICYNGARGRYDGKTTTLAESLGMHVRNLRQSISTLVERGYLLRKDDNGRRILYVNTRHLALDDTDRNDQPTARERIETISAAADRNDQPLNNLYSKNDLNYYKTTRAREAVSDPGEEDHTGRIDEIVFDQKRIALSRLATSEGYEITDEHWQIFRDMVATECAVILKDKPQYTLARVTSWAVDSQKKTFLTDLRQSRWLKNASERPQSPSVQKNGAAYAMVRGGEKTQQREIWEMSEREFAEWLSELSCGFEQKTVLTRQRVDKLREIAGKRLENFGK